MNSLNLSNNLQLHFGVCNNEKKKTPGKYIKVTNVKRVECTLIEEAYKWIDKIRIKLAIILAISWHKHQIYGTWQQITRVK